MKQVTTITLTFTLTHKSAVNHIEAIRNLVTMLHEYDDDGGNVELVTDEDTDNYTFVRHNGKYSRQFGFKDMDTFLNKYAQTGSYEIASAVRDHGKFVSCESKTEEVEDAEQQ